MRRVFISYSHDSEEHAARVVELAQWLRERGVEAWIDAFEAGVEDWARWMQDQIERADVVVCVCTATYLRRWKEEDAGSFGVTWEARTLRTRLYYRRPPPIRPVTFGEGREVIPEELQRGSRYELPNRRDALLRDLLGEAQVTPRPVARVFDTRLPDHPDLVAIRALEAANRRLWLMWLVSLPFSATGLAAIGVAGLLAAGWAGWMVRTAVPVEVPVGQRVGEVVLVRVDEAHLSELLAGLGGARAVYVHANPGAWSDGLAVRTMGEQRLQGEWDGEEEVVRIRAGWGWRWAPLASAWPCQIGGEVWAGAWLGAAARGEAGDLGWCEERLPRGRLGVVWDEAPLQVDRRGGGPFDGQGKVVVVEVWRGAQVATRPVLDVRSGEVRHLSEAAVVAWSAVGWARWEGR